MDVTILAMLQKQIKGLTSGVKSASVQGTSIVFTMNDDSKQTMTFPTPADGISITDVSIDTDRHLICTMSDGTTLDAGEIPTIKGDKGFSPTITENPDNTKEIYKLDVTNEDGTFTTPNLKGTGGGLDPDKYYDKTQIDGLIEPLDEAKHTHDNKDTVLDKLGVSADGNLLFDGNEIKGSVEIDDTSTSATDKTWSAKKINGTADEIKQSVADVDSKFADYDTSAEVDTKITTALTDYEKSADVDTKITAALMDYEKSADVDTKLGDYYKKTETYSNTEIDGKFIDLETNLTADIKAWVDSEESLGIKTAIYQNNTLIFYKKPNATADDTADFTIDLPVEQFLDQTKTTFVNEFVWSEELYPNSTDPNLNGQPVLVLGVKGDTTVSYSFVSMNELVKIYKADMNTSTVTLTIDDATNTISASINISADTGNLLEVGTDGGLYAKATDISGKADKLTDTDIKENQILVDDGNGNIGASGKSISEYIPAWSGTKAEWEAFDKSTLADGAIVNITDDYNENLVQVKAIPDTANEGDVLQYIGQDTSDYTNGYFYKYVADETGILSWRNIPVMQVYTPENKEVLDKFSENDEGKVVYDNKPLASDNLWTGTKAEYDAITDKDPNKVYVVTDEEPTLADYILDDTAVSADKTWSSEKIATLQKQYATIPIKSISTTLAANSSTSTYWENDQSLKRLIPDGATYTRWRYIITGVSQSSGTLKIGNTTIALKNDQVSQEAAYPLVSSWVTTETNALINIVPSVTFYAKEFSVQIEYVIS